MDQFQERERKLRQKAQQESMTTEVDQEAKKNKLISENSNKSFTLNFDKVY